MKLSSVNHSPSDSVRRSPPEIAGIDCEKRRDIYSPQNGRLQYRGTVRYCTGGTVLLPRSRC